MNRNRSSRIRVRNWWIAAEQKRPRCICRLLNEEIPGRNASPPPRYRHLSDNDCTPVKNPPAVPPAQTRQRVQNTSCPPSARPLSFLPAGGFFTGVQSLSER